MNIVCEEDLARAYTELLSAFDLSRFRAVDNDLAGIFLPSAPVAPVNLMIVGKETRGWLGRFEKVYEVPISEYVAMSMSRHRSQLEKHPQRSKFLQFHRSAQTKLKNFEGTVAWHNLFAVSFRKKSPTSSKAITLIAELSRQLLRKQIELLQPRAVLFVTGAGYDKYLKSCFDGCIYDSHVVEPKRLWRFRIGNAYCLRTTHPRFCSDNRYRVQALQEIEEALSG